MWMWDVGAAFGDDGSGTGCATHRPPVGNCGAVGRWSTLLWEGAYLLVWLRFDRTTAKVSAVPPTRRAE